MATRLSVIMVHSPPSSGSAQQLAESVVGELIGRPGIDLTLIGPIQQLSESSTDQLSLDSLSGDVAVLDWHSPKETIEGLHRLGFQGQRAAHPHDSQPDAPREASASMEDLRRIYAFDLTQFVKAGEVLESLGQLKQHQQVKTFTLGLAPNTNRQQETVRKTDSTPVPSAGEPIALTATNSEKPTAEKPVAGKSPSNRNPRGIVSDRGASTETGELDLDDLLDQLDRMDP